MVLGKTLTDENGEVHKMAGLLPVHTSFAERKLHLGYRTMVTQQASALGPAGQSFKGHEFHYASLSQTSAAPLFRSADALGETSSLVGCVRELYVALSCTSLMQANALTQNQKVAKTDFNRNTFSACPGRPKRSQLGRSANARTRIP